MTIMSGDSPASSVGEDIVLPIVTLQKLLLQTAEQYPHELALVCRAQPADFLRHYHSPGASPDSGESTFSCLRWTYSNLLYAAQRLASSLRRAGVRKGMRIAALLFNGCQFPLAFWASALLGCAFVPINPRLADKPDDIQYILRLVDANVLFVWDAAMARVLADHADSSLLDGFTVKIACGQSQPQGSDLDAPAGWLSLDSASSPEDSTWQTVPAEETTTSLEDLALVIFTSGTTSRPKGVKQTNRSFVAGVRSASQGLALDSSRSSCNSLPVFHIFGIMYAVNFWSSGGFVCYPAASFDPRAALKAIEDEKLTNLPGVPSLLNAITNNPAAADTDFSSLLEIDLSASVILPETIADLSRKLGVTKIAASFGMSEGVPITTIPYRDLPYAYAANLVSSGKCCPGARVRVCAPDSRTPLKKGESGELHIGGPMVAQGYLGDAAGQFYEADGTTWLVSGDQAMMQDNEEIFVLGRYKDIIIRAGENISPASIEAVLDTLPSISSQVVGVVDETAGEVPVAIIKTVDGKDMDLDSMRTLVTEKLGTSFLPDRTLTVADLGMDDFPKTDSGKIKKAELKDKVVNFMSKEESMPQDSAATGEAKKDVRETVYSVWSSLLGMSHDSLSSMSSVSDFADSITMMRAASKIKKQTGRDITVQDMMDQPTLDGQVTLLERRWSDRPSRRRVKTRSGPPGSEDMAHTLYGVSQVEKTKAEFSAITKNMDLSWGEDVEDVVPVWDFGRVLLRRLRSQSWNHRHVWVAKRADAKQLRHALELTLAHHPVLRMLAMKPQQSPLLHAIIRPSARWFQLAITNMEAVATADDLRRLALNDAELDFAAAPGPLFRAIIAPIKDTGTAGLIYQVQHSCFDSLSIPNLIEDLGQLLDHPEITSPQPRAPYKEFADALYLRRTSPQAQADCNFHVQRLKGLAALDKALWPTQRAPGWFKGYDGGLSGDERKRIDGDKSIGLDGITKQTQLPHMQQLKRQHGVSAPAAVKTALALLNSHYTHEAEAVFSNYEAGRFWPFLEDWITALLPDAMDVDGPTWEIVLNRIPIVGSETCASMMKKVHEEQELLTKHAHAPLLAVQAQLGEDGKDLLSIMQRQVLNWLPSLQEEKRKGNDKEAPLQCIQVQARPDVGLLWNCAMLDQTTLLVTAGWDDAQLGQQEVKEMLDRLFGIMEWITAPSNWDKSVELCPSL